MKKAQGKSSGTAPLPQQLPAVVIDRFMRPGLPKYVALRDALVHAVASGHFAPGARLPNESELAASLPLSLGTIQRALRMLVDDGVIVRRPGAGSFVAQHSAGEMRAPLHCRFVDDEGTGYLPVYPRIVARYTTGERGEWNRHLGVDAPLCIERILRIGDEFSVFSRFYVDASRLPAFERLPVRHLDSENFKALILRESGLAIGRITQYLSSVRFPADVAEVLKLGRTSVAQRLDIEAFAGRGRPLYFQTLWIPANGRRLHLPGDGRDAGLAGSG